MPIIINSIKIKDDFFLVKSFTFEESQVMLLDEKNYSTFQKLTVFDRLVNPLAKWTEMRRVNGMFQIMERSLNFEGNTKSSEMECCPVPSENSVYSQWDQAAFPMKCLKRYKFQCYFCTVLCQ